MHNIYLSLVVLISLFMIPATSTLSIADEEILAPSTRIHDSDEARETIESGSEGGDLNRELSAPETVEGSEVHSFIRKDGAEITEYSVKGIKR